MQNNLKLNRLTCGFTQSQLASLVGTTKTNISNLENGIYSPTLKMAYKLSFALGVCVYDLFLPDANEDYILNESYKGVNI